MYIINPFRLASILTFYDKIVMNKNNLMKLLIDKLLPQVNQVSRQEGVN